MTPQPGALERRLGRQLAAARRRAQMTQRGVAVALGLSLSHISQIEQGRRTPSLDVLARWARLCHATLAELFAGMESDVPPPAVPA